MKGNGKKLAVFVIVAALAVFMAVATASADPKDDHALKGQYAFSGPGHCVVSPAGFGENYIPNVPEIVFASSQIWEGVYTFNRDGSGSIRASHSTFDHPSLAIGMANVSWDFTYKMIDKNRFQTSLPKGNYDKVEFTAGLNCDPKGENCATLYFDVVGPCDGVVSRDGDAIIITCGPPTKLILCAPDMPLCTPTPFEAYCTFSHQGTLVRDKLR